MPEYKRLIISAFATLPNMQSGANVSKFNDKASIYYKNIVVALVSAKINNPNCDVALVTNIDVPEPYKHQLEGFGIRTYFQEFDTFLFDSRIPWGLAFYKLAALRGILNKTNYDKYLLVDNDVYFQSSINDLWEWCDNNIVLLDIGGGIRNCWGDRMLTMNKGQKPVTHFGGEFIAGSKIILCDFINQCDKVYAKIIAENETITQGDEHITSAAVFLGSIPVKHAGSFIYRYWTRSFYKVETTFPDGGGW